MSKQKKLGSAMLPDYLMKKSKSIPSWAWLVVGGVVLGGGVYALNKFSGIFSGVGKATNAAGEVLDSAGNLVSTALDNIEKGASKIPVVFGLEDSESEKTTKDFMGSDFYKKAFDPSYWKSINGLAVYNEKALKNWATVLNDELNSFFNVDEDKVNGIIRKIQSVAAMSHFSDLYFRMFNADLWSDLGNVGSVDLVSIVQIIKNKPKATYIK